jgi:hypothetical protein
MHGHLNIKIRVLIAQSIGLEQMWSQYLLHICIVCVLNLHIAITETVAS